jgi:hypothetical protein
MHWNFGTALVLAALTGSIILVLNRGDRLFPVIALVVSGLETLMVFNILSLSSGKFRIDVILPAALALAGGICWSRSGEKSTITAATVVALIGLIQLVIAIRLV